MDTEFYSKARPQPVSPLQTDILRPKIMKIIFLFLSTRPFIAITHGRRKVYWASHGKTG